MPVTYFGPVPSAVQRELVGAFQNLKAGKLISTRARSLFPSYEGATRSGQTVWSIVTDTDDKGNADALGLNYSPKLTFADVGRTVRKASLERNFKLVFDACCGQNVVTQRLMAVPKLRRQCFRVATNSTAAGPAAAPQQAS